MSKASIEVGEYLYEVALGFTGVTEFGVPLAGLLAGQAAPHPAGTRFDIAFRGTVDGPRISGEIHGVDYLEMRADGRFELNLRAVITTQDQQNIAFSANGILQPQPGCPVVRLVETATLKTASPDYAWVNSLLTWGIGSVDPAKGEVRAKVYSI